MKRETIALNSLHDNLKLYASVTIPDLELKGVVHIMHGLMECKELYNELAAVLASYGYVVMVCDQRGHGQSYDDEHPLGYFDEKDGWILNLKDNNRFARFIRERYRNLPYFILGCGVGSLIARAYLKRYEYEISGVILSNSLPYTPLVTIAKGMLGRSINEKNSKSPANFYVHQFYNDVKRKLKTKNDCVWLSNDEEVIAYYNQLPTCGHIPTHRLLQDVLFGYQDVYVNKDWHPVKKQLPILFLAGNQDPCIDYPKGIVYSINKMKESGYQNIEYFDYPNRRHLLFLGLDKEFVYSDFILWLNQKVKK